MSIKSYTYSNLLHLHLESGRKRPVIFQLHPADWAAAAKRHRALAKQLRVTVGQDNEILDEANFRVEDFELERVSPSLKPS